MDKGGGSMANVVKNNRELLLKLTSTGLLFAAANEKIKLYIQKHHEVMEEMMEDEDAIHYMGLYYEENAEELIKTSKDSAVTGKEAEASLNRWRDQNDVL